MVPKDLKNIIIEFGRSRNLEEIHVEVIKILLAKRMMTLYKPNYFLFADYSHCQDLYDLLELDNVEHEIVSLENSSVKRNLKLMSMYYTYYFKLHNFTLDKLNSEQFVDNFCTRMIRRVLDSDYLEA